MANMTISAVTARSGKSRMRRVTFSETTAGAGSDTTSFPITGKLLRFVTTGGDGAWTFTLNDGTAVIFTSASLTATATSGVLNMHATVPHDGIPMAGQTLLLTTVNSSSTAATVTIIWEESAESAAIL